MVDENAKRTAKGHYFKKLLGSGVNSTVLPPRDRKVGVPKGSKVGSYKTKPEHPKWKYSKEAY